MPAPAKKKKASKKKASFIIDDTVGNYEKHPFFVKKANEGRALLKAAGLPKRGK
jgi:hypothetical protein